MEIVGTLCWENGRTNTPSHADDRGRACSCHKIEALYVFVAHFFVVPRWVVLGEIIGNVKLSWRPDEVEHVLFDAVLHPPIPHVKSFGEFLAHLGIEDSVGAFVVGFEGCAGRWLWVCVLISLKPNPYI